MSHFFNLIFYYPILNLLIYVYETAAFHDFGLAIIFVTIIIRVVLYPVFHRGAKQQMLMQRIQPHVKKIQEQHKNDKEKQAQAMMALYKEHGVNPFSSFLLLIIQIPIMLALYWVVGAGFKSGAISGLYSFISQPGAINPIFLGLFDLSKQNLILIVVAAIAQYFQSRLALYKNPDPNAKLSSTEQMTRQMAFIGPVMTIVIFYSLPAAVGLYWLVTSVFSVFQQLIINRHFKRGETAAI